MIASIIAVEGVICDGNWTHLHLLGVKDLLIVQMIEGRMLRMIAPRLIWITTRLIVVETRQAAGEVVHPLRTTTRIIIESKGFLLRETQCHMWIGREWMVLIVEIVEIGWMACDLNCSR